MVRTYIKVDEISYYVEPTAASDNVASEMRAFYEKNREGFFEHWRGRWASTSDNLMLGLYGVALREDEKRPDRGRKFYLIECVDYFYSIKDSSNWVKGPEWALQFARQQDADDMAAIIKREATADNHLHTASVVAYVEYMAKLL